MNEIILNVKEIIGSPKAIENSAGDKIRMLISGHIKA